MKTLKQFLEEKKKQEKSSNPKYVPVDNLTIDNRWWDREGYNEDAVERYRQLYEDGSEMPILIQKDTKLVIDGYHRLAAAKDAKKDKILTIELDVEKDEIPLIQILANLQHGVPLSHTERDRAIVRAYIVGHKTQTEISEMTGLSRPRIEQIIARAKEKLESKEDISNDSTIIANIPDTLTDQEKEALLTGYEDADKRTKVSSIKKIRIIEDQLAGFIQEETAGKFDISQSRVSQILGEFRDEVANFYSYHKENSNEVILGHTKKETSVQFGITGEQVDKLLMEVNPEPINFNPIYGSFWPGFGKDDKFGQTHPGNIPAGLVKNILYFYSKPGDVILDPFAGGGVVIDVANDMIGRKIYAFDLIPARDDIQKHDITTGLPNIDIQPNLILLDPPYGPQKRGEYTESATDLSQLELDKFYETIERIFGYWDKGIIVLLMGGMRKEGQYFDLPFECEQRMKNQGWTIIARIVNEIANPNSLNPTWQMIERKEKLILNRHIDILVGRK